MSKVLSMAYADPPYPGQAHRYPEKTEVNTQELLRFLMDEYSDGWALSTSSPALREIFAPCPPSVRVAAWVKPFAIFKPGVNPGYTWEPVLFYGGRKGGRTRPTVKDHLIHSITLRKGLVGAKPPLFCHWVLNLLGALPGDCVADLFPGTGVFTEACQERHIDPSGRWQDRR